jgi:hypothetical protein
MEKNAKVSIQYDAFVKAVRPDSKATESTVFLEGFIGESSLADHFRLYSDASLNDFVEIPTNAVVHSIANSKEESALGGSKIWVKKDAIFTYGNPAMDNRPQASFLDGDLYQGYMDNMFQADTSGGNMGAMGGGFENMASRPLCVPVPLPQTMLCPVNPVSRFICPTNLSGCPPISRLICPSRFCPSKLFCPTFGACPSIACNSLACNPGGGGRPFDANQGMADQFGGSFNPYFEGDLYQGYMDNMYQPQADTSGMDAGQADFMQQPQTFNPAICGGTINPTVTFNPVVCGGSPITKPQICLPQKSLLFPCITNPNFPPCKKPPITSPFFPPCNGPITVRTCNIICKIPKTTIQVFCGTIGNGPIVSIADCPSFPCPTPTFKTETINPNPNVGGGIGGMNDQFGGDFNPYFDGDLNKAYMENMYQPQADAGMGNMAGPASQSIICGTGGVSVLCTIRPTIMAGCEPSRLIRCPRISLVVQCPSRMRFDCVTHDGRISLCHPCVPWTWTRPTTIWTTGPTTFPTTTRIDPRINPGDIRGGGGFGQMGDDFNGSFNPYGGF